MKIRWYGHACFRVWNESVSIVTDPYTPAVAGLTPVTESADIVVRSSRDDPYHSCYDMVSGRPALVDATDLPDGQPTVVNGVAFQGFPTMESVEFKKEDASANAMYTFAIDGVRVLHLGDVGNAIPADCLGALADRVDVMFALTGGPPTIELDDLAEAILAIGPRIVIPMHYALPKLTARIQILPVEAFTSRYSPEMVKLIGSPEVDISANTLPRQRQVYVLEAAG
jgi:L-ascorbate metabolism protein UlaG (beta-lactamase superfamily)